MVLRSSYLRVAWVGLLVGACFSEPGVETTGAESTGGCSEGQQGCPCYANGTCDGILACDIDSFLCVPDGCTPGELDCVCVDGSCLSPLVCLGSICVQEDGSTDGESSAGTGGESVSVSTTTSVDTTAGSESVETGDASSSVTSETTSVETGDSGGPDCNAAGCGACLECVLQPGGACDAVHDTCSGDQVCDATHQCLADCVEVGFCNSSSCCEGVSPDVQDKADEVIACQETACSVACAGYMFWACP
jgi:hypothetical protein